MRTNEPDMNITNQINAALADIRTTLVSLSEFAKTPDISDQQKAVQKVTYQTDLALTMIYEHRFGIKSQPWSDRKHAVDEEFS